MGGTEARLPHTPASSLRVFPTHLHSERWKMVGHWQETARHRGQTALTIRNKPPEIQLDKGKGDLEREQFSHPPPIPL